MHFTWHEKSNGLRYVLFSGVSLGDFCYKYKTDFPQLVYGWTLEYWVLAFEFFLKVLSFCSKSKHVRIKCEAKDMKSLHLRSYPTILIVKLVQKIVLKSLKLIWKERKMSMESFPSEAHESSPCQNYIIRNTESLHLSSF